MSTISLASYLRELGAHQALHIVHLSAVFDEIIVLGLLHHKILAGDQHDVLLLVSLSKLPIEQQDLRRSGLMRAFSNEFGAANTVFVPPALVNTMNAQIFMLVSSSADEAELLRAIRAPVAQQGHVGQHQMAHGRNYHGQPYPLPTQQVQPQTQRGAMSRPLTPPTPPNILPQLYHPANRIYLSAPPQNRLLWCFDMILYNQQHQDEFNSVVWYECDDYQLLRVIIEAVDADLLDVTWQTIFATIPSEYALCDVWQPSSGHPELQRDTRYAVTGSLRWLNAHMLPLILVPDGGLATPALPFPCLAILMHTSWNAHVSDEILSKEAHFGIKLTRRVEYADAVCEALQEATCFSGLLASSQKTNILSDPCASHLLDSLPLIAKKLMRHLQQSKAPKLSKWDMTSHLPSLRSNDQRQQQQNSSSSIPLSMNAAVQEQTAREAQSTDNIRLYRRVCADDLWIPRPHTGQDLLRPPWLMASVIFSNRRYASLNNQITYMYLQMQLARVLEGAFANNNLQHHAQLWHRIQSRFIDGLEQIHHVVSRRDLTAHECRRYTRSLMYMLALQSGILKIHIDRLFIQEQEII